ncbi:MAG: response regulator transcription factor [Anaerolineales bacterium]|nr:response regulator transcription factor [Anaerolineales bacterium]
MKTQAQQGEKIRVAILDDHISSLDSYQMRLSAGRNIEVVASRHFGDELPELFTSGPIHVLILDVGVPNSEQDRNPYPILHVIPGLREEHPEMGILIISMYEQPVLVRLLLEAGANGYILKEDQDAIMHLAEIVTSVSTGGIYLSRRLRGLLADAGTAEEARLLSKRQHEALSLVIAYPQMTTEELGVRMNVASSTARNLLSRAYRRLGVRSRIAAAQRARELGLQIIFPEEPHPGNFS